MEGMKVGSADNIRINYNLPVFRSEAVITPVRDGHDEFVASQKPSSNKKTWLIAGGVVIAGVAAFFAHKAGWFKRVAHNVTGSGENFKNVDEAKKYFENIGIKTEFCDVTKEHLPLLNRIKDDMKKIKELGVKIDKPDSLTVSDWHKVEEYEELCRKKGICMERREEYFAFCANDRSGANHIFVNSSKVNNDYFRHEMGHANHFRGHDSFWEAKGIVNQDFADKQLDVLGQDIKIYRGTNDFKNIFQFMPDNNPAKFAFPNQDRETRFIYVKNIVNKMNEETHSYAPDDLSEQIAYVFDGLVKGDKTFSDEVMLYYDFAGGARIPNLKINGKTYDEYIESLYNNPELIQRLKNNITISKL